MHVPRVQNGEKLAGVRAGWRLGEVPLSYRLAGQGARASPFVMTFSSRALTPVCGAGGGGRKIRLAAVCRMAWRGGPEGGLGKGSGGKRQACRPDGAERTEVECEPLGGGLRMGRGSRILPVF